MKKNSYTKLKVIAFIICMVGAAYAGYEAGGYWHTQKMQMAAIAHSCATIDSEDMSFKWHSGIILKTMPKTDK